MKIALNRTWVMEHLENALEAACHGGLYRALKHRDDAELSDPVRQVIAEAVTQYVTNVLYEVFDFGVASDPEEQE